ncbi:MAG: type II secretion system protein [Anaerohalosphaeraceae bacterium]
MSDSRRQNGFSLTEVLLATGILAIGFVLIATIFPAGIKLTAMAAEKTLAPAIAEEARAAVRLYDLDADKLPNSGEVQSVLFSAEYLSDPSVQSFVQFYGIPPHDPLLLTKINARLAADSLYPSLPKESYAQNPTQNQRYCWTILCRKDSAAAEGYQIRIFLCRWRKELRYYGFEMNRSTGVFSPAESERPVPVPVRVRAVLGSSEVSIESNQPVYPPETCRQFFLEGAWVVEDRSGSLFQVIKRDGAALTLNRKWTGADGQYVLWVVPPAAGANRNPCIEVL